MHSWQTITGLVEIDTLPVDTKADIAHFLAERHPYFVERSIDHTEVWDNLFGLAQPPKVLVVMAGVERLNETMNRENSSAAVSKYVGDLNANPDGEFDPILTSFGEFQDGGHRLEAYRRAGRARIPAVDIGHLMSATKEQWQSWFEGSTDPSNPIYGNDLSDQAPAPRLT
jgi:uncharacterized ParB-like nuclease family protein